MTPTEEPRDRGAAGPGPHEGALVGSGAGAAGCPAEPSCGDVAGMCVGGRQGGGEGGRGSGRGSSSFDKQLPEHFQTPGFRPTCTAPAALSRDGAHASGQQQVGTPGLRARP